MALTDPLSRAAYQTAVARLMLSAFAPWVKKDPTEFAEQVLRMPGEHGSTRRWSFDFFPPQREMFTEIFNPRNREIVFKMASRLTKTMTVLGAIGYCMSESPRKILVMWPKIGDSEEWSKKHLMGELVDPTPELAGIIMDGRGRRLANNTILNKSYPGGYISMFGANVPGDFRRAKGNFLYADEIDAIATAESDEGDQLRQFAVRGSEYPDTIQVYCSYPSLKGQSNIDSKYDLSDKRVWEVACAKCNALWVMHRKDLRYDKEATELSTIQCPTCHALHDDQARYSMSRGGQWVATTPFRGIAGFHANALLWPHPVDQQKYPGGFLQMLALEELAVEQSDNPERARRVLVNTRDAESYTPEHLQKIEHSKLYKRRGNYDPRDVLPSEVVFITAGADLQANRAEIKFKGWGHRGELKQSWAIDYRIVRGSPLQSDFWERLESTFRNSAWKHPSGQWIHPSITLFDSRFRPDEVYAFARKMQRLRVYACEGATVTSKPIVPKKPIKRGVPPALVWEIGTHEAKDVIYQQLEIDDPNAQGYCHYPATVSFTEEYFRRLTIEESLMQRGRDGNFYRFFFKASSDDRNEPLDCEVYANAAEQIFRPNYERLRKQFISPDEPAPRAINPDMDLPKPRARIGGTRWMFAILEDMNADILSQFRNERYDSLNRLRWEQFLSMGIPLQGKTVFEPGAGIGDQTEWLLSQGVEHIYVNEGRDENVAEIAERFGSKNERMELCALNPRLTLLPPGNLEGCLPFYGFYVDFIYCYGVYYHIDEKFPEFPILRALSVIGDVIAIEYLAGNDSTAHYGYDNPSTSMTRYGCRPRTETLLRGLKDIFGFAYAPKTQLDWHDPVAPEERLIAVGSKFALSESNLIAV